MNEVRLLLQKAGSSLEAAEILVEAHPDSAMSRAYYGCFYGTGSIIEPRACIRATWPSHCPIWASFAKTGLLDTRYHALLSKAFGLRQGADYEADAVIEAQELVDAIRQGREFLAAATTFLQTNPG